MHSSRKRGSREVDRRFWTSGLGGADAVAACPRFASHIDRGVRGPERGRPHARFHQHFTAIREISPAGLLSSMAMAMKPSAADPDHQNLSQE